MPALSPVHLAILACVIVGIILPINQFKSRCNNVEAQFLSDKEKHKENIASLHEQCQQQLDEHLTAKQESFQRQIDRLRGGPKFGVLKIFTWRQNFYLGQ